MLNNIILYDNNNDDDERSLDNVSGHDIIYYNKINVFTFYMICR